MKNMGDIQKMMKQAQKIQQSLIEAQGELENKEVEGSSGGGVVKVVVTGKHVVKSVTIAKEAVDPEDIETLEDLVTAAVNDAVNKANDLLTQEISSITGGMNIPGMPGGMGLF